MPTLNLSNSTTSASEKLSAFDQPASFRAIAGQKTPFDRIPAFYVGGGVKEHFPYVKDENGKKVLKKDAPKGSKGFPEYEREKVSDGFLFSLRTPDREALYVVTRKKPELEVGSFYLVSGLGYGRGQYPSYLDERITLEKAGQLTLLPSYETILKED